MIQEVQTVIVIQKKFVPERNQKEQCDREMCNKCRKKLLKNPMKSDQENTKEKVVYKKIQSGIGIILHKKERREGVYPSINLIITEDSVATIREVAQEKIYAKQDNFPEHLPINSSESCDFSKKKNLYIF